MSYRLRPVTALFRLAALFATFSCASALDLKVSTSTGLPILYPYHGMLLDHNLHVIPRTDENVAQIFRTYTRALEEVAPNAVRNQFLTLAPRAKSALSGTPRTQSIGEAALARWLLERLNPELQRTYGSAVRPFEAWAGFNSIRPAATRFSTVVNEGPIVEGLGLKPAEPKAESAVSYIDQCKSAGVPIPPDWGSADWKLQGQLDSKYTFAGDPSNITQVWAFANSSGTCMALPRRDQNTKQIGLLGIICQGKTTGKACFWDNIDKKTGARLSGSAGEAFSISAIQDGSNLSENCTNCHRGSNVFLIHPGTSLELQAPFFTDADVRYAPVSGQPTWGNPGPKLNAGTKPCATCHEIPEFGQNNNTDPTKPSAYCRILEKVVNLTMPSLEKPAGWNTPDPKYESHVNAFRETCAGEMISAELQ